MKKECLVCHKEFFYNKHEGMTRWNTRRFCSIKCANNIIGFQTKYKKTDTTRTCVKCGIEKSITEFFRDKNKKSGYDSDCKSCFKLFYQANKEFFHNRNQLSYIKNKQEILIANNRSKYLHRYGIHPDDKTKMMQEQDNKCVICNKEFLSFSKAYVDHNHATKQVRAILCNECNTGLGSFKENPIFLRAAANYLEKWNK